MPDLNLKVVETGDDFVDFIYNNHIKFRIHMRRLPSNRFKLYSGASWDANSGSFLGYRPEWGKAYHHAYRKAAQILNPSGQMGFDI
jgi:hypothetical protein